jgi:D-glycero-D-manno-heptose 1,7-bisphosphate phosphatase
MKAKAIFFDRDGTLLVEMGYIVHPSVVVPYRVAARALKEAKLRGFVLIAVTNQSGVARGFLRESDLAAIHERMQGLLGRSGAALDAIYYCPHHVRARFPAYRRACDCRKPGTALGMAAAKRFDIDLAKSFVIGDKLTDLQFGTNLGVTPCLVRTGYGSYEEQVAKAEFGDSARVFDHVLGAVDWIVSGA